MSPNAIAIAGATALLLNAYGAESPTPLMDDSELTEKNASATDTAVAVLRPAQGNTASGTITFTKEGDRGASEPR